MSDAASTTANAERRMRARAESGSRNTMAELARELLAADRIVVASHLNPDGDAAGSARALGLLLTGLGKDVVTYIHGAEVPREYQFIRPDRLIGDVPDDLADRVLICVDCGNEARLVLPELIEGAKLVLNLDHHGDNTHFGDVNHVRPQSACAAELVWELAGHLGVSEPGVEVATAVYVGLVTDTGRFQYSNTTPESFELAAELVRAGVDVHDVFSRIYETLEFPRVRLLGRALERSLRTDDGWIVATHLRTVDFEEAGAGEDDSEGIVDTLRSVDGTRIAVFLRDLEPGGPHLRKGSLRTTRDDVDVSVIARTWNGGGHRQAAGFNTDDDLETVVARVEAALHDQLGN